MDLLDIKYRFKYITQSKNFLLSVSTLIYQKPTCYIDGEEKNDLKSNIKNLVNMISTYYKEFLIESVNDALNDKRDANLKLPDNLEIKI